MTNSIPEGLKKYVASLYYLDRIQPDHLAMSVLNLRDNGYGGSWEKMLAAHPICGCKTVDKSLTSVDLSDLELKIVQMIKVERSCGVNLSKLRSDFIEPILKDIVK